MRHTRHVNCAQHQPDNPTANHHHTARGQLLLSVPCIIKYRPHACCWARNDSRKSQFPTTQGCCTCQQQQPQAVVWHALHKAWPTAWLTSGCAQDKAVGITSERRVCNVQVCRHPAQEARSVCTHIKRVRNATQAGRHANLAKQQQHTHMQATATVQGASKRTRS